MTITMKRLLNLCLILTIFLFSVEVSVAAENSEVGEKWEYIQLASNADSLKEKMDKMDDEEKRLKSERRVYEQRSKQFKKIMNQLYSKWSKAGLMTDYTSGPDQGYFNFNCSPWDGGEFGGEQKSIVIKSISFNPKTYESSDDSLDICSTGRRKREETCVSIAWDEVIDKKGGINLHRIEEESRSAIASFFNLPVDTPLQDIVATQTSLSNDAKKKLKKELQISKSINNEFRLKIENATEKALTKIASKTKVKFYQVSQSDIEDNFLLGLKDSQKVDERRKKNKLYSYHISNRRSYECAGEIVDHTVFIIIKAKYGQKGDYIKLILSEEISDHLGHVSIATEFSYNNEGRYRKDFDFDPAISAKDVTEALVEDGIAGAVEDILENGGVFW